MVHGHGATILRLHLHIEFAGIIPLQAGESLSGKIISKTVHLIYKVPNVYTSLNTRESKYTTSLHLYITTDKPMPPAYIDATVTKLLIQSIFIPLINMSARISSSNN